MKRVEDEGGTMAERNILHVPAVMFDVVSLPRRNRRRRRRVTRGDLSNIFHRSDAKDDTELLAGNLDAIMCVCVCQNNPLLLIP